MNARRNVVASLRYFGRSEPYLGLLVFFSFFKTLELVNATYYPTINRVTHVARPFDGTLFSTTADSILMIIFFWLTIAFYLKWSVKTALITGLIFSSSTILFLTNVIVLQDSVVFLLPIALSVIILITKLNLPSKKVDTKIVIQCLAAYVIILETLSLAGWIIRPVTNVSALLDLEQRFFYILNSLSPLFLMVIITSFVFRFLVTQINHQRFVTVMDTIRKLSNTINVEYPLGRKEPIFLIGIVAFSVFVSSFPHMANENGFSLLLGVDNKYYVRWMAELYDNANNAETITYRAFLSINGGDRPLTLLLIHAVSSLFNISVDDTLVFLPMFLSGSLAIAVYVFVSAGTRNKKLALLASFMSVVSYHMVVGIYSAFLANWLALSASLLALTFLVKIKKISSLVAYAGFGAFALLALFIHSYTGAFLLASTITYIMISILLGIKTKTGIKVSKDLFPIAIIVIAIVAFDIAKTFGTGTVGGVEGLSQELGRGVGLEQFALRWNNLQYAFTVFLGGYLANIFVFVPAAVWAIFVKLSDNFNRLILSQIAVSIIPILVGDFSEQARIFFDLFLYIPASILIFNIYMYRKQHPALLIIALMIVIAATTYTFRSLSNLELIFPS